MNFTLDPYVKNNRLMLASGDARGVLINARSSGKWYIIIGVIACVLLVIGIVASIMLYKSFMNIVAVIVFLLFMAMFIGLIVSGIKKIRHPEQDKSYQNDYLGMVNTISRNTGYPQTPYRPEQWEIPVTAYTPEVLANILNLVGGWGQDNTFFICNLKFNRGRTVHVEDAHIFNLCEKGIFLIPISLDAGVYKAYVDLCTVIPTSNINNIGLYPSIYAPINTSDMDLDICSANVVWDIHDKGNAVFSHSTLKYEVKHSIDGAPFHECNVNRLYQLYGSPSRIEDIRKARQVQKGV